MPQSPAPRPHRRASGLLLVTAVLLAVSLVATSCGDDDETVDSGDGTTTSAAGSDTTDTSVGAGDPGATADGSWALDAAASSLTDVGDTVITLGVRADNVSGSAGCNTYNGSFAVDGDAVTIGELAVTRMACEEAVMAAETEYLAALATVDTIEASADALTLSNADGITLAFTAIDPSAEIVGEWSIVNYATADALVSAVEGTDPTITFADDGTVSVVTGCNNLATSYSLDGDTITFEPAAATMMACEDPPGVMDQEAALGAALENATTVEVAPGQLTILDGEGNILIVAASTDS